MKTLIAAIIAAILIITAACSRSDDDTETTMAQLRLAEQYMTAKPDIALKILDSLDKTDCPKDHYFALLYSQAKYRNYIKADNDSLVKVALKYYTTSGDSLMKARSLLMAAQVYRELDENSAALEHIHKAAETAMPLHDTRLSCQVYYIWGRILQETYDTDGSTEKFELSLKFAKELGDTALIINRLNELGYNYLAKNDYKKGLQKLDEAIELATATHAHKELAMLYGHKSLAFYVLEDYKRALEYINRAMSYNKYLNRQDSLSNLNFKGKILIHTNQLDSARYYIKQGKDTSSMYSTSIYYESMCMLMKKQRNYKTALEYCELRSECLLQMLADLENDKIAKLNKQYNTTRAENENARLRLESRRKGILAILAAIMAIAVIMATYAYVRYHRTKARLIMQKQLDTFNDSLRKMQQRENAIIQEQLKAHEEAMAYAHNLEDKNRELEAARQRLNEMRQHMLDNNAAVKKIREILKHPNNPAKHAKPSPLDSNEIAQLIAAIDNCHDNFATRLAERFTALSVNDVFLCCLIKLGLDNPGLCAILDISDNTLRKRKSRLKREKIDTANRYATLEEALHDTTREEAYPHHSTA